MEQSSYRVQRTADGRRIVLILRCESLLPDVPDANGDVISCGAMRQMVDRAMPNVRARRVLGRFGQNDIPIRMSDASHVVTNLWLDPMLGLSAELEIVECPRGGVLKRMLGLVGGALLADEPLRGLGAYEVRPAYRNYGNDDLRLMAVDVVLKRERQRGAQSEEVDSSGGACAGRRHEGRAWKSRLYEVQTGLPGSHTAMSGTQEDQAAAQDAERHVVSKAERQHYVEQLHYLYRCPVNTIAQILGTDESRVRDDLQEVRDRLVAEAEHYSAAGSQVPEEISALLGIAGSAMASAQRYDPPCPSPGMSAIEAAQIGARFLDTAAHCFFLVGRLKQGQDV